MQNFINVCAFHFARGIVQFAMGGGIFLIGMFFIYLKNYRHERKPPILTTMSPEKAP